jgi:hypothetical protein
VKFVETRDDIERCSSFTSATRSVHSGEIASEFFCCASKVSNAAFQEVSREGSFWERHDIRARQERCDRLERLFEAGKVAGIVAFLGAALEKGDIHGIRHTTKSTRAAA